MSFFTSVAEENDIKHRSALDDRRGNVKCLASDIINTSFGVFARLTKKRQGTPENEKSARARAQKDMHTLSSLSSADMYVAKSGDV